MVECHRRAGLGDAALCEAQHSLAATVEHTGAQLDAAGVSSLVDHACHHPHHGTALTGCEGGMIGAPLIVGRVGIERDVDGGDRVQVDTGHDATHGLAEALVLGKIGIGEECVAAVRHLDTQQVVLAITDVWRDVDHKGQ